MDLTLRFSAHPSEEVLEAYALKQLPEDQIPAVETHLLVCEACQHALADLDAFIASIKGLSPQTSTVRIAPVRSMLYRRLTPALAAAAGLLLGAFWLWDSGPRPESATVLLSSMRGRETGPATGPANVPLEVNIDSTQLEVRDGFRVELVTAAGRPAWSGPVIRSAEGKLLVRVEKGLSAGSYWVRLYSPDNQLVQEYGLRLH